MNELFDVKQFVINYFQLHHCSVNKINENELTIPLTKELDLALMNRPFYWNYVESVGIEGKPLQLHITFDPTSATKQIEWAHIGSPIMKKIVTHLENSSRFTRLYENVQTKQQMMLQPWLVLNMKVRYRGTKLKEELLSIGLNLIHGTFQEQMMDILMQKEFSKTISSYCYKVSPIIKIESGYKRIETYIHTYVMQGDLSWVEESKKKLHEELSLLEKFYEGEVDKKYFEKEKTDLINRLDPMILIEIFSGGIFYLVSSPHLNK